MKTKPNEPIAAFTELDEQGRPYQYYKGLTKREHFAGLAMQGIIANQSCYTLKDNQKAEYAIIMADLLIEELNRTQD